MSGFRYGADGVPEIDVDADATDSYGLHWYEMLRGGDRYWAPRTYFVPGEVATPPREQLNGYRYRCTVGGKTGTRQPVWPPSGTVTDGGVTWELAGAEDRIASSSYSAEAGVSVGSTGVDATKCVTTVVISGGTEGKRYLVTNEITTDHGRTMQQSFRLVVGAH